MKTLKTIDIFFLALVFLAIFVLAIFVHYHTVLRLDVFLSRDLQSEGDTPERKTLIYHFFYFISLFGRPLISAILVFSAAFLFWLLKYYQETIFCLFTPISAGINFVVKILVARPRPTDSLVKVLDKELDPSFPSGHVVFYVVFFGYLFTTMFFVKKIPFPARIIIGAISVSLIILISFSRVYLGVHWATDTLGGYLLGLILLFILLHYYFKYKKPGSKN